MYVYVGKKARNAVGRGKAKTRTLKISDDLADLYSLELIGNLLQGPWVEVDGMNRAAARE
jgi:hypothetical protein